MDIHPMFIKGSKTKDTVSCTTFCPIGAHTRRRLWSLTEHGAAWTWRSSGLWDLWNPWMVPTLCYILSIRQTFVYCACLHGLKLMSLCHFCLHLSLFYINLVFFFKKNSLIFLKMVSDKFQKKTWLLILKVGILQRHSCSWCFAST